jgi:hypothetical protein
MQSCVYFNYWEGGACDRHIVPFQCETHIALTYAWGDSKWAQSLEVVSDYLVNSGGGTSQYLDGDCNSAQRQRKISASKPYYM